MIPKGLHALFRGVHSASPLVHCITNPISINQCANAILAVGARPIMAEHPREVREITATARALLLNLGNITDARMKAIETSAKVASELGIPTALDLVGAACSDLRRDFAADLIRRYPPTVIKGNYSEIKAVCTPEYKSSGVDADKALMPDDIRGSATTLSRLSSSLVLATGKTDIIANDKRTLYLHGGSRLLTTVTGTGCMLGALCATYLTVANAETAAVAAGILLAVCGKNAETDLGSGSFSVKLMDNLCRFSAQPEKYLKSEDFDIEEI